MANNLGRTEFEPNYWPDQYPDPAPKEYRSPKYPPFEVGDQVIMRHNGYRIKPGQKAEVRSIKWYERRGEWVMHVGWYDEHGRKESQGYRAYRFEKENAMERGTWMVVQASLQDGKPAEMNAKTTMIWEDCTREYVEDRIKTFLKHDPDAGYAYGRLTSYVTIAEPPIVTRKI